MITIVPDYYQDFCCKADRCRHSCCKSWEVDIDPQTAERYRSFGALMEGKADLTPGNEHFLSRDDGCCAFLTETGLCRLILEKGEGSLCQICRDHPRFRNYYDDHVEMGLGLCCEKTGELLFAGEGPVTYESLDGEDPWDQAKKTSYRVKDLIRKMDAIPEEEIDIRRKADFLLSLEHLDDTWTKLLLRWKESEPSCSKEDLLPVGSLQRLKEYLAFRHGKDRSAGFMKFCFCLCKELMETVSSEQPAGVPEFAEICRMFSSEIEYSTENLERIETEIGTIRKKK